MRVKICKNCAHWRKMHMALTAGLCRPNDMSTLDLQTCSAFTYRADADEYPDVRRGGGGGGDDDGPVDITPRGPKGGAQIRYAEGPWRQPIIGDEIQVRVPISITYDPDGDKKD